MTPEKKKVSRDRLTRFDESGSLVTKPLGEGSGGEALLKTGSSQGAFQEQLHSGGTHCVSLFQSPCTHPTKNQDIARVEDEDMRSIEDSPYEERVMVQAPMISAFSHQPREQELLMADSSHFGFNLPSPRNDSQHYEQSSHFPIQECD